MDPQGLAGPRPRPRCMAVATAAEIAGSQAQGKGGDPRKPMVGGQLAHWSLEPDLAVPTQILALPPKQDRTFRQ